MKSWNKTYLIPSPILQIPFSTTEQTTEQSYRSKSPITSTRHTTQLHYRQQIQLILASSAWRHLDTPKVNEIETKYCIVRIPPTWTRSFSYLHFLPLGWQLNVQWYLPFCMLSAAFFKTGSKLYQASSRSFSLNTIFRIQVFECGTVGMQGQITSFVSVLGD